MQVLYKYDASVNWIKTNRQLVLQFRLFGALLFGLGCLFFYAEGGFQGNWEAIVRGGMLIVLGGIQLFNPYKLFMPRSLRTEFIYISDTEIVTRDGPLKKVHEYSIDDIESYKVYVGQVGFKTKSGVDFKFSTHKIHDKQKHKELFKVLKEVFSSDAVKVVEDKD